MSAPFNPVVDLQPRLRAALERLRPRLAGLDKARLLPVNLDPFTAASTVRGAVPAMLNHRADLLDTFRKFDISNLDELDDFALALLQAETVYRALTGRSAEISALLAEAFAARQRLVVDANSLAARGRLHQPKLSRLNTPNGYRSVGADLLSLSTLLRESWPSIAGMTPITLAELDQAEAMAEQLLYAIASRRRRSIAAVTASDDRQRAFTLMVNAYDEVRQAIIYLLRHSDEIDRIAPSLYRKRRTSRTKTPTTALAGNNAAQEPKTLEPARLGSKLEADAPEALGKLNKVNDPFIH